MINWTYNLALSVVDIVQIRVFRRDIHLLNMAAPTRIIWEDSRRQTPPLVFNAPSAGK